MQLDNRTKTPEVGAAHKSRFRLINYGFPEHGDELKIENTRLIKTSHQKYRSNERSSMKLVTDEIGMQTSSPDADYIDQFHSPVMAKKRRVITSKDNLVKEEMRSRSLEV